jgi:hypothetical protein
MNMFLKDEKKSASKQLQHQILQNLLKTGPEPKIYKASDKS